MTVVAPQPALTDLLSALVEAPPARLAAEFRRLAEVVWNDGRPPQPVSSVVPMLVDSLDHLDDARRGYVVVLLGLLAETAEEPVRMGLGRYLELVRRTAPGTPLRSALLYLLSHFPADRGDVLAAVAGLGLEAADQSRLDRALRTLDRDSPDLGRVWPSPSVWRAGETETLFHHRWTQELGAAQIEEHWNDDTRTVLSYSGAKAYWAVRSGAAVEEPAPSEDMVALSSLHPETDVFGRHVEAFRCPRCGGRLRFVPSQGVCQSCAVVYPIAHGILDLSSCVPQGQQGAADLLLRLAEMPSMGLFYEAVLRPAFLRIAGGNWADAVTPADEDAYVRDHVRPVAGPVLDLACGAGRWTSTLAQTVGADRVIAVDAGLPMLNVVRGRLPETAAVLAGAFNLPFGDASLGAVNCWNSLQAFPRDAWRAIDEVGRCLRPGGTFTLMTFRYAADPIERYFQSRHSFPGWSEGIRLFDPQDLRLWLEAAGMTVCEESGPAPFVFITAERASTR